MKVVPVTVDTATPAPISSRTAILGEFAAGHERVLHGHDAKTGLRAIIAIHSTLLGPALGGTRFYPYANEDAALADVLRLSRGMTYKAATAGLDLGGGKAVIIGDPHRIKTPELLEAYGRLVETLRGDYITAGDVGTTSDDMDVIGRTTRHVVARTKAAGGSGDSAPLTALGVFQSIRAAAQHTWGSPSLEGRTVGVEGLGKVGHHLVGLVIGNGGRVIACDVDERARSRTLADHREVELVDRVIDAKLDVYAPCAMGATLTASTVDDVRGQVLDVFDTVEGILTFADDHGLSAGAAADHFAQERLDAAACRRDDA